MKLDKPLNFESEKQSQTDLLPSEDGREEEEKGDHEAMIKLAKGPGQESCWKATNGRGQNCFIVLTRRNHLVCLKKAFGSRVT